jgi:hypothetical protein
MDMQAQNNETRATALYRRDLPGGGFVAIDVCERLMRDASTGDAEVPRTRVYVERRSEENRRSGHEPPIIAEIMGVVSAAEVGELYRMAADNAAVARALLAWQTRRLTESSSRPE